MAARGRPLDMRPILILLAALCRKSASYLRIRVPTRPVRISCMPSLASFSAAERRTPGVNYPWNRRRWLARRGWAILALQPPGPWQPPQNCAKNQFTRRPAWRLTERAVRFATRGRRGCDGEKMVKGWFAKLTSDPLLVFAEPGVWMKFHKPPLTRTCQNKRKIAAGRLCGIWQFARSVISRNRRSVAVGSYVRRL